MERGTGLGTSSSTSAVISSVILSLSTEFGAAVMEVHQCEFLAEETTGDVFPAKDLAVGAARQTEVVYRRGGDPGNGASVDLPELLSLRRGEEQSEAKLRVSRIWRVGLKAALTSRVEQVSPTAQYDN